MLQQMVSVAELEAGMILARTKAALATAKARGQKARRLSGRRQAHSRTERYGPQRACGARANRHTADASRPMWPRRSRAYRRPARRRWQALPRSVRRHCCAAQRARHSDVERPRDMASRAGEPGLGRGFDLGLLAAAKTTPCERRGVQTALAPEIKTPGPGADGSRGYTRDAGEGDARAHPTNARK